MGKLGNALAGGSLAAGVIAPILPLLPSSVIVGGISISKIAVGLTVGGVTLVGSVAVAPALLVAGTVAGAVVAASLPDK